MTNDSSQDPRFAGHLCPSCERYIGPADICPYCDADSAKSPVLRFLRYAALALAIVGLGFLYLMVARSEVPVIKVGEITPMMNFAYVRVAGTVDRKAFIGRKKGKVDYLSFSLNDGSGQLRVAAYRNVARTLVEKNLVPKKGVIADVTGSLSVAADGRVKLYLRAAEHLRLTAADGEAGNDVRDKNNETVEKVMR